MELTAAIKALEALERPAWSISIPTRNIVKSGITEWMLKWKKNGWRTADRKPVKNIDLWQRLDAAAARHEVSWHWLRGHDGLEENERADELARDGMQPFLSS